MDIQSIHETFWDPEISSLQGLAVILVAILMTAAVPLRFALLSPGLLA